MKEHVMVVMPAYNAEKTLERTFKDIPSHIVEEVLLVDDFSKDNTVNIAERLGLNIIRHDRNKGYGANQKTCYTYALNKGATIIILLHPDYQYDPTKIPQLIRPIQQGKADMVLGSRLLNGNPIEDGMPLYKYVGNRLLTTLENITLKQSLSEFHTGMRAYSRKLLQTVPWQLFSSGFLFDTEMLVHAISYGFRIDETPVPARYFREASSIGPFGSIIYGLGTLAILGKYVMGRLK